MHAFLSRALQVSPNQLKALSIGTFIYAGLLLTEGTGLLLRKTWAEYFTIVTTAGLIPLEIYEITRHLTAVKVIVLAVNVSIVVYLVLRVRRSPKPWSSSVAKRSSGSSRIKANCGRARSRRTGNCKQSHGWQRHHPLVTGREG